MMLSTVPSPDLRPRSAAATAAHVQGDHVGAVQVGVGPQRLLFPLVLLDLSIHLEDHYGRCENLVRGIFDDVFLVEFGFRSLSEIFYPACRVDENQRRSPSSRSPSRSPLQPSLSVPSM